MSYTLYHSVLKANQPNLRDDPVFIQNGTEAQRVSALSLGSQSQETGIVASKVRKREESFLDHKTYLNYFFPQKYQH